MAVRQREGEVAMMATQSADAHQRRKSINFQREAKKGAIW
jgi:hypothetical protein